MPGKPAVSSWDFSFTSCCSPTCTESGWWPQWSGFLYHSVSQDLGCMTCLLRSQWYKLQNCFKYTLPRGWDPAQVAEGQQFWQHGQAKQALSVLRKGPWCAKRGQQWVKICQQFPLYLDFSAFGLDVRFSCKDIPTLIVTLLNQKKHKFRLKDQQGQTKIKERRCINYKWLSLASGKDARPSKSQQTQRPVWRVCSCCVWFVTNSNRFCVSWLLSPLLTQSPIDENEMRVSSKTVRMHDTIYFIFFYVYLAFVAVWHYGKSKT